MACICGNVKCQGGHVNSSSGLRVTQNGVVEHLQRRPGESFAEMRERLAKQ